MATSSGPTLVHSVHFYGSDAELIRRLQRIVSAGLQTGNAILIVATEAHRLQLTRELEKWHINVRTAKRDGHLLMFDAEETLAQFMRNGSPDETLFRASVGKFVADAKETARNVDRGLTVFGEMVALLWERGEKQAALRLEAMWNNLLRGTDFHLHCAYPKSGSSKDKELHGICQLHTEVVAATA